MALAFKKINNDEMFHCVPIKPGDKSICLGYKSYRTTDSLLFTGCEIEVVSIERNQIVYKIDTGELDPLGDKIYHYTSTSESTTLVTLDWFNSNHTVTNSNQYYIAIHKEPNLTQTKISKHFRKVQPGEMDTTCETDFSISTALARHNLFCKAKQVAMFLGTNKRPFTNAELSWIYKNHLISYEPDLHSSYKEKEAYTNNMNSFFEGMKNVRTTFSSFLIGDRKEEISKLDFVKVLNAYKDPHGPSMKAFDSWVIYNGKVYVSKNRKMK